MTNLHLRPARRDDWDAIRRLLEASDLPLGGAEAWIDRFVVAERDGAIVGCATVEVHDRAGLLRSVAVRDDARSGGIGRRLVEAALDRLPPEVRDVYLLTTTADAWFPRLGFEVIRRDELPPSLNASEELRGACPATAVVMKRSR